jgi:hypothetical protein
MDAPQGNGTDAGTQDGAADGGNSSQGGPGRGDGEQLRLRAILVPRGAAVPSDRLEGMTDTVRIPVRIVSGQGNGASGGEAGGGDASDPHETPNGGGIS